MSSMPHTERPHVGLRWLLLAGLVWQLGVADAVGQFLPGTTETPTVVSVQVDAVPTFARTRLRQIEQLLDGRQWPEAIDALTDLVRDHGDTLVSVDARTTAGRHDGWWISLRAYADRKIAHGPAEGLAEYRRRVDPLVETRYREAAASHDRRALADIIAHSFPSSWSDDALNSLAELALEAGDFDAARMAWQRLLPPAEGSRADNANRFPDPAFAAADIEARLVLTSVLQGPAARSAPDVAEFKRRFPDASGTLAGRDGRYADMLASLEKASHDWPNLRRSHEWTSFGGGAARQAEMADAIQSGGQRWVRAIDNPADRPSKATVARRGPKRASQLRQSARYFPVTWRNTVLVASESRIVALDYRTGQPAWGLERPVIYRAETEAAPAARMSQFATTGQPQFTLTVVGDRLLARMGPAWTQSRQGLAPTGGASLVCLNLKAQGRLEWKRQPDEGQWEWAFEGTPVSDGRRAYVCVRRRGVYPECHVECIDMNDGATIWRKFVCTGRHAAGGRIVTSHNLITLVGDMLYVNTNMGAVAALSTDAGQLHWIRQYPDIHTGDSPAARSTGSRRTANNAPSPCLVNRGRVFVAPHDSDVVMAIDADDGRLLWHVATRGDIGELLGFRVGVEGGELIASGRRLWCLAESSGKAIWRWPPGSDEVHAAGRGFVLDGNIYWPTSDNSIRVFREGGRDSYWPSQLRLPMVSGQPYTGDLLAAGDILLVTSQNRLLAIGGARSAADTVPRVKTSRQPRDIKLSETR